VVSGDAALLDLLTELKRRQYRFTAVTPATHARVLARPAPAAPAFRDIFGWNRPFAAGACDPAILQLLRAAQALDDAGEGRVRSRVRVASLGDDLFLHSAFPTDSPDSVFFGPDTYRFARFLRERLHGCSARWTVDMGAGSGAGGILAVRLAGCGRLSLVDVNGAALRLAGVNAQAAGVEAEAVCASAVPAGPDVVVANPPYMIDPDRRAYRDGGDLWGGAVALDWAGQALRALAPGGRMLLYTGAAFVNGTAPMIDALGELAASSRARICVEEIDPDVFGEELDRPAYREVERIAAVGVTLEPSR
jgi:methylase of polypeptide subunit release factors